MSQPENVTITRKFEFDAGHRLVGHESKCSFLHGHRYVAEVTVYAPALDTIGRIIDFSVVKNIIGHWIDKNWDHNMILNPDDPLIKALTDGGSLDDPLVTGILGRVPYLMPRSRPNPTVENMIAVLGGMVEAQLATVRGYNIQLEHLKLYETPNCWAELDFRGTANQ